MSENSYASMRARVNCSSNHCALKHGSYMRLCVGLRLYLLNAAGIFWDYSCLTFRVLRRFLMVMLLIVIESFYPINWICSDPLGQSSSVFPHAEAWSQTVSRRWAFLFRTYRDCLLIGGPYALLFSHVLLRLFGVAKKATNLDNINNINWDTR